MAAKKDYYEDILKAFRKLKKDFPNQEIGKHIWTALSDYGNFWGISDKEFAFALRKYIAELEFIGLTPESELNKIIEEGKNLDKLFANDEFDEFENEDI